MIGEERFGGSHGMASDHTSHTSTAVMHHRSIIRVKIVFACVLVQSVPRLFSMCRINEKQSKIRTSKHRQQAKKKDRKKTINKAR